jgi:hypothetical protein
MSEMAKLLYRLSQQAQTIRVTSPAGTGLLMTANKKGSPSGASGWQMVPPRFSVVSPGHRCSVKVSRELWFMTGSCGLRRSLASCVDGSRLRLIIDKGYAIAVEGGREALIYRRWLRDFSEPTAMLMDHACYDFNPGIIKAIGRILEDEHVFGCMQFGVGAPELGSPICSDGVVLNPSVGSMACRLSRKGDTSFLNEFASAAN